MPRREGVRLCIATHQADKNAKQLNDISVGDAVEAADERVKDGNTGRQRHRAVHRQVQDDCQGGA